MSLVQAVITNDFILVGSDKRGITDVSGEINNNCNKIIKLNKGIIFGCTGSIKDNFKLFNGFCYLSKTDGFINFDKTFDISYNDFVNIISYRFNVMYKEHMDKNNPVKYNIGSMVCGFNGTDFEVMCLGLGEENIRPQGIAKTTKPKEFPCQGITLGIQSHINSLHDKIHRNRPATILQYKNIMKDVFNEGAKFDNTINNICCFEKIKKKDVLNE